MRKKFLIKTALLTLATLLLAGCSLTTRPTYTGSKYSSPVRVDSVNDMEERAYYIMHSDGEKTDYFQLYRNSYATFNYGTLNTSGNNGRLLWFFDDFGAIPTLYDGDKLVFKSSSPFEESFIFERFEYLGPTVGIANLQTLSTGRLYVDTSERGVQSGMIPRRADAFRLSGLNSSVTVIDKFGTSELRSGNISRCGSILGLEENASYPLDVYVGSAKYNYNIKADSILLCSMGGVSSNKYSYIDNGLVEIAIPASFNSGYYLVNGLGLFRYVKGTAYSDNTDFNIPNNADEFFNYGSEETGGNEAGNFGYINESSRSYNGRISIDEAGIYMLNIILNKPERETVERDISARLITSDGSYAFDRNDELSFTLAAELNAGEYDIEVTNADGLSYYISKEKLEGPLESD